MAFARQHLAGYKVPRIGDLRRRAAADRLGQGPQAPAQGGAGRHPPREPCTPRAARPCSSTGTRWRWWSRWAAACAPTEPPAGRSSTGTAPTAVRCRAGPAAHPLAQPGGRRPLHLRGSHLSGPVGRAAGGQRHPRPDPVAVLERDPAGRDGGGDEPPAASVAGLPVQPGPGHPLHPRRGRADGGHHRPQRRHRSVPLRPRLSPLPGRLRGRGRRPVAGRSGPGPLPGRRPGDPHRSGAGRRHRRGLPIGPVHRRSPSRHLLHRPESATGRVEPP